MTWTNYKDVVDRWVGEDKPTDEDLITALILDAEAIILSEYPAIQGRIDAGTLSEATVVMVVCRMVSRLLRNPEGLTYWQQQTGPFGQARNYGSNGSDIWMTAEEEELLAPKKRGKAYELNLAPNPSPGNIVVLMNGNTYIETGWPIADIEED